MILHEPTPVSQLQGEPAEWEQCGPACCASVLTDAGQPTTVSEAEAWLTGHGITTRGGTSAAELGTLLRSHGVEAAILVGPIRRWLAPMLARRQRLIWLIASNADGVPDPGSGIGHWIELWGLADGQASVMNPLGSPPGANGTVPLTTLLAADRGIGLAIPPLPADEGTLGPFDGIGLWVWGAAWGGADCPPADAAAYAQVGVRWATVKLSDASRVERTAYDAQAAVLAAAGIAVYPWAFLEAGCAPAFADVPDPWVLDWEVGGVPVGAVASACAGRVVGVSTWGNPSQHPEVPYATIAPWIAAWMPQSYGGAWELPPGAAVARTWGQRGALAGAPICPATDTPQVARFAEAVSAKGWRGVSAWRHGAPQTPAALAGAGAALDGPPPVPRVRLGMHSEAYRYVDCAAPADGEIGALAVAQAVWGPDAGPAAIPELLRYTPRLGGVTGALRQGDRLAIPTSPDAPVARRQRTADWRP